MDKNDIIRMAREAGAGEWGDSVIPAMMDIEHFAKLVAAAKREACASLVEEHWEIDEPKLQKNLPPSSVQWGEK